MELNLNSENVAVRENRLNSITGFKGSACELSSCSGSGQLKERNRCQFCQASDCLSARAIMNFSSIRNISIVYHAPSGCAASMASQSILGEQLAAKIGKEYNTHFVCTDVNESDTVFGATETLRKIIEGTYEAYKSDAIFVCSSCTSSVIGENIDDLISEMRDSFPVPLVSAHCEGFKSKAWASGWDIVDHAILQGIIQPPEKKTDTIIIKNFFESMRNEITELFARINLKAQFIYANSTIEELRHLSEAKATVCVCGTLGTYLGNALEQLYGIPYVNSIHPLGINGFEKWMREIGRVTGREKEVEKLLAEEKEKYTGTLEELKKEIKGLTCVLAMGPGYAFEIARELELLGMKVQQIFAWHYDTRYDNGKVPSSIDLLSKQNPDIPILVTPLQNFEWVNEIKKHKPDIFISRHGGLQTWACKLGVAALNYADEYSMFGYAQTIKFVRSILDAVKNRSFEDSLSQHTRLPYTHWWFSQNEDKFLQA